jgi:hypothetical protein
VCSGWDRDFVDDLKSLVPEDFADRIIFVETATPEDRLYHVENSIVVIPSDYESLCLFAFEAAIAGRKVILNGACPAFGNGVRWHDGANCVLFDGSVESLTGAMENALSWRPTSTPDVVPSRPYWLGDAAISGLAPRPSRRLDRGVAVLCYGAQSPTEFHRQFDLACDIAAELTDAKAKHEIVFLLPRGSFAPDGPESEAIQARGWTLALSSGNRECPQMFGKRIVDLGRDAVFLLPFGYEVLPGFVSSAVEVLRSQPSVAIVSGHIDLVDPNTGRSDSIRTYSGEAPSSALLSSRIAAPLCLLNITVLERIPFDALAGSFWFEVFARTCALNGEEIVIMPVIAATLDALMQHRPETTKRVAAGLLDQRGIASGWQARLLSVDPVQIPSAADGRPMSYDAGRMRQVFRVNPTGRVRSWEPVGWQEHAHGALVHPLDGHVTIGELAGPYRRVSRIVGHVRNVRHDNAGADVAIALARSHIDVDRMLQIIRDGAASDAMALSAWKSLAPGETIRVECPCYGVSKGHDKILLIARPADGASDANAEIVFTGVDLHFENISIG